MSKFFARSELEKMRPAMRAASRAAIEAVATKGRMDIAPYCYKMTAGAWCALMGIEFPEVDRYIDYLWGMLHQYDYSVRFATARRMLDASKDLYEKNLGCSAPGLFNAFINCAIEGARPSASQCTGFILFQLLAGLDTMGTTAAWTLHHLASRPVLQERLAHDSDAIPKFMEEMFRRYAILATNRFVRKDYEIDGVTLKAGDNVLLSAAFACMDSHHFQCPAEVHPGRPETAFGLRRRSTLLHWSADGSGAAAHLPGGMAPPHPEIPPPTRREDPRPHRGPHRVGQPPHRVEHGLGRLSISWPRIFKARPVEVYSVGCRSCVSSSSGAREPSTPRRTRSRP
jgi:cytochrome P450